MAFPPLLLKTLILSSCILIIFYLVRKITSGGRNKLNLPPSPRKLPIIGNLHQLGKLPHHSLKALSDKYGPLMLLHMGCVPTLIISSAEMVEEMVKNNDIVFSNRPQSTAVSICYYGCVDVAFSPHGEYWKQMRKICVIELLTLKRVNFFQLVREEQVAITIDKLKHACRNETSVNLSAMILQLLHNVMCRCLIGRNAEEEGNKELAMCARKFMMQFKEFSFGDVFPSLRWMDVLTGLVGRLKANSKDLDVFLDKVIEEHSLLDDEIPEKKDFVHILLELQKSGSLNIPLAQDNIKAVLLDMVFGGDTTATTMEWAMAELMKNPTIMRKTQEEIRRVVGKKSKIEVNDIIQMNYLKCVIKETFRLRIPSPIMPPREISTSIKLGGYDIPAKTTVFINAMAIQTDPKRWDNPLEFIPERFEKDPLDYMNNGFHLIPFGMGRRQCPGMNFGIASLEYLLANLLFWFDWKLPDGGVGKDLDMGETYGLAVHKAIPLHLVPTLHSF